MNEHLYNRLRHEGLKCFELPTQHVNLLSAFNKKSNRVKKQAMLDVKIGDLKINQIVLLSPQLLTDAILGLDFLVDYKAVINFAERSITLKINGENTKIEFIGIKETTNALEESSSENQFQSFGLVPSFPRKLPSLTADSGQYPTEPIVTGEGDTLVKNEERETSVSEKNKEQHVEEQVDLIIPRRVWDRDENVEFASRHDDECRNFYNNKVNTLAQDKEGHIADDYGATGHEINKEYRKIMNAANGRSLCFTTTRSETNAVDTQHTQQGLDTRQIMTDYRIITAEQLRGKVSENNNLSPQQQDDLYDLLIKYQQHLTKRPGRCTKFEYEFKIEGSMPTSANSRPIPFVLRDQVRDQIQIMLKDDILEESFSSYINPLTPVVTEAKPLRICVDARRINRQMTADRTKVLPLRELLQKFHGASYITSLDLSSAFLQVPLKETSRQWTAFQFQSKAY